MQEQPIPPMSASSSKTQRRPLTPRTLTIIKYLSEHQETITDDQWAQITAVLQNRTYCPEVYEFRLPLAVFTDDPMFHEEDLDRMITASRQAATLYDMFDGFINVLERKTQRSRPNWLQYMTQWLSAVGSGKKTLL